MRRPGSAPPPPAVFILAAASLLFLAGCPGAGPGSDDGSGENGRPLSEAEVRAGLAARDVGIQGCVRRARQRQPGLSGRVTVAGTIGTAGRVGEVRIASSTAEDAHLQDCILGEVRLASFPESAAETPFEHAFDLGAAPARRPMAEAAPSAPPTPATGPAGDGDAIPFDRQAIEEMATRQRDAINRCYQVEANRDPDLAGRVEVAWAVDPHGAIRSVVVTSSTLNNDAVESCIVRNIRGWRFQAPGGAGMHQASYAWAFAQERAGEDGPE